MCHSLSNLLLERQQPPVGRRGRGRFLQRWAWFVSRWLVICLVPPLLASCASGMVRGETPEKPKIDRLASLVRPARAIGMDEDAADALADSAALQGRADLVPSALVESDPLPKVTVARLSFSNSPLQDVLQAVVGDANMALSVVWDNPESKVSRSTVTMSHLGGELTTVLNKLADSYGFYWQYKDGMLHISADRQYIAAVPPIADLFESLPIMVKTLGGTDVFLDRSARMITFRAGSQAFGRIKGYLDMTRKNRSLIVYDTYLWEVILNDTSKMGIDWGALPGSVPTTSLSVGGSNPSSLSKDVLTAGLVNAASGGTGLALSLAGSQFSMNVLLDFLRSQGTINSLSQPKIQLLSGGKATLKDEIATTYVSRVGSSSISAGTVIPGSVETSEVKTGVTLEVSGDVSDGTIYSDIALRVSDLIGMGSATVSGSTITLPKTSSREVRTHVRAKQGDTILLAGIQYDKVSNGSSSGMGIERSNQSETLRSELIIILKPRVKSFINRQVEEKPVAAATPQPVPPAIPATPIAVAPARAPVILSAPAPAPAPVTAPVPAALPAYLPTYLPVVYAEPAPAVPRLQAPVQQPMTAKEGTAITPMVSAAALRALEKLRATDTPPVPQAPATVVREVPKIAPPSAKETRPGLYLQVAAFADPANAETYRQDVERSLGRARSALAALVVVPASLPKDGNSHRLLAGPFLTRPAAEQWAVAARDVIGDPSFFVVR